MKHHRKDPSDGEAYSLSGSYSYTTRGNLEHELGCAWVYALYCRFLELWDENWDKESDVHHDRVMRFRGTNKNYFIEVDLDSEPLFKEWRYKVETTGPQYIKSINHKIDRYLALRNGNRDLDMQVLFIVGSYPGSVYHKEYTEQRIDEFLNLLEYRKTGKTFLVANLEDLKADPFGNVFRTSLDRTLRLSLVPQTSPVSIS